MQINNNSEAMLILLVHLMDADNITDMRELVYFNEMTQYTGLSEERMAEIILSIASNPALFEEAIDKVTDQDARNIILMSLTTMVYVDKKGHPYEKEFLSQIAKKWKAK